MHDTSNTDDGRRVFKRCFRCGYSLRGLPARHACPECGLRYDEDCEIYPVVNPRQALMVWLAIFGGGFICLKFLRHFLNFAAASMWERIMALVAVVWMVCVALGVRLLWTRYRRGFAVAITTDGLMMRLPGQPDNLIAWSEIESAAVIDQPKNKPQMATISRGSKGDVWLTLGGVLNVFPTRADAQRFAEHVRRRVAAARVSSEETKGAAAVRGAP